MNRKEISILLFIVLSCSLFLTTERSSAVNLEKIRKYNLRNILATHTTYFKGSNSNRIENVKVSARKIDGVVLQPGEFFSFNDVVGPRNKKNGFKEAIEIVNNEFVTGVGGGVCQVSSTLYNSVLFAGLKIIDRKNHSRPVSYVPLGRGATVYYGLIDFKFKNNFSNPIMIMSRVLNNQLTIALLGTDPGIDVEVVTSSPQILDPEVVKKSDDNLKVGTREVIQSGKVGYKVTTRRIIKSGSKIVENKLISEDIYPPIDKVIKVNPE